MFPQSEINTEDAPDIVLAILAGETPTRCFNHKRGTRKCTHWARRTIDEDTYVSGGAWYCFCCARQGGYKPNSPDKDIFLCDGTRI